MDLICNFFKSCTGSHWSHSTNLLWNKPFQLPSPFTGARFLLNGCPLQTKFIQQVDESSVLTTRAVCLRRLWRPSTCQWHHTEAKRSEIEYLKQSEAWALDSQRLILNKLTSLFKMVKNFDMSSHRKMSYQPDFPRCQTMSSSLSVMNLSGTRADGLKAHLSSIPVVT